ncbi:hypothetical protein GQX73_g2286 [Xylaria multiplex]|uniref:Uncharacterized protein n=1 Tax=Xylaria multiplex TaxID=323545 RepID=A0A7C8ISP2_9PEZI|nr:hypothetical protein GQX73_g2286 [Xylaria multiplex]
MALAVASTASLKPKIRLAQAVSEFEASLSSDQKSRFRLIRSQAQFSPPQINDVMRITAEVDAEVTRKLSVARCYGPRFTYLLQAVQQFAALGDIIVGGSQNLIACGVWSLVRMTILSWPLYGEIVLFMNIGRSSPRYQALAILYSRSRRIQGLLTRYFIVVVEICHYFVRFSNKSRISQITSSLDDSKLKSAEEDINRWAQFIRDEADFLQAETTEREARQNEDFREWAAVTNRSAIHCQKVEKRIHRLSLFSSFDYETPWKQIRKRGSASSPLNSTSYKEWKAEKRPCTILMTGKMGWGKSVIMANIVDDLDLRQSNLVLYFFCRRDNPDTLGARGIFGSLTKHVLQGHINSDTMDDIFEDFLPRQNKTHQVHIVLDGFDECDDEETELVKHGLIQVQPFCKIIISIRSQANDPATPRLNWDYSEMIVPENNPDLKEFIDSELRRRIQSKTLSLGSPELIIDIRDALLGGARGMFLWVVLQIECICAEQTDDSIRKALLNLPKDLSSTFRYILQKSKHPGLSFQRKILKLLVGAKRPLVADELREALSVAPYESSWAPDKIINNVYNALKCCGGLILIDEEELTVRLIHQSVAQFLVEANEETHEWAFTPQEADHYIGEVTVTYLNYSSFEQRLSTKVASCVPIGDTPAKIIETALQPYGLVGQLALAYLQPNTGTKHDIGKVLSEASSQYRRKYATKESFKFLSYASDNWLHHTRWISPSSELYSLWQRLLNNPRFAEPAWSLNDNPPDDIVYDVHDDESEFMWRLSRRVTWSIFYSHLPLLSTELRGRHGIKAFCSIMPYLTNLQSINANPKFSREMGELLLRVATMFRAGLVTDWLLRIRRCTMDNYYSGDADEVVFLVDHMEVTQELGKASSSRFSSLSKYSTDRQLLFSDITPFDIALAKDMTNLGGFCEAMALIIPLVGARYPGPLTDSIIGVAVAWSQEILGKYFLVESQPIDLIEASLNYTVEFVRDLDSKKKALRLLGQLFKPLHCSHSKRHMLLGTLLDIFRVYSAGVLAIWTMHHAILEGYPSLIARDYISKANLLKIEVVELAKILLHLYMPGGKDERGAESISEYITAHLAIDSRHLEGRMECLLQQYGISFGLGRAVRDPVQELYSDGWQRLRPWVNI